MTQPEIEIRGAWRQIVGNHFDRHIDSLLGRYAEPHRRYHTATHIMLVLRDVNDAARAAGLQPSSEVLAAVLYHDAIYDPQANDNEVRSADLAAVHLSDIGWSYARCRSVAALVLATAGHLLAHDDSADDHDNDAGAAAVAVDTAQLLDADLAILGADPGAYLAYVNGVRAEYSHVDDNQWRAGRTAVLQRFLDRPRLFITEYMFSRYEHRARANIEAEVAGLRAE
jgi:predicted metal-dependent HD superfamily phosphohydrolase